MRGGLVLCLVLGRVSLLTAQDTIPVLTPVVLADPDLTPARISLFEEYDALSSRPDELLSAIETARLDTLGVWLGDLESPCDAVGMGCSWYCGGGPDTVLASSTRPSQGPHAFAAVNAHDLNLCTAWSEGVDGPGIGEQLIYRFHPESPRLHSIMVANGLVLNDTIWHANNRVKRLRVAENGVPVFDLDLADERGEQQFKLPRLMGKRADGEPMELTFTILAIYPGERTHDTVISELWFDGIDVH